MSNNWIVENIQNALDTWNDKLNEIWRLLSQSPTEFKGGTETGLSKRLVMRFWCCSS